MTETSPTTLTTSALMDERRGGPHRRIARRILVVLFVFAPLLVLTGWNLTRTTRIEDARKAYSRGDTRAALRAALDHLDRRPWSTEANRIAALCLSRLDFADEAEPYYRKAGRLSLDESHFRVFGLVRGNHREMAIQAYKEMLERWPDNVLAMRRLGGVYITQKADDEVLKVAARLIETPGGASIGYTLRGVIHQNDKNWIEAASAFEHVLEIDPQLRTMPLPKPLFWTDFANDLLLTGRVEDARRQLTRAVETEPTAELLSLLGSAHDLGGATDDAEACFRRAGEMDPTLLAPQLNLGRIALRRQRPEDALTHLLKAEKLSPRDYDTMYSISLAYRRLGRADLADRFLARAEQFRAKPPPAIIKPPTGPLPKYAL